jgi:Flp pilus assembly protein TadG
MHPISRIQLPKMLVRTQRKLRQNRGVSAVEFALIAPVLVLMLFGATEISLLVSVDRKTTIAASTLGDLASQSELVSCHELSQIAAVTRQVFEPYNADNTTLVVANLVQDGSSGRVEWSRLLTLSGGVSSCDPVPSASPLAQGKTIVMDTTLFAAGGGGIVVGDVEKIHSSVGTSFISNNIRMKERFYLRPRRSLKLKWCTDTSPGVTAETCSSTT